MILKNTLTWSYEGLQITLKFLRLVKHKTLRIFGIIESASGLVVIEDWIQIPAVLLMIWMISN